MTLSIVTAAKNENLNLNEWLSYHQKIGVNKVYLYCNDEDCQPMYKTVLPFIESGFVIFRHTPLPAPQVQVYAHLNWLHTYKHESSWVTFLDVDEYITLGENVISLEAYLYTTKVEVGCIYLNWFNYGHSGHNIRHPGRILQNYTKRRRRASNIHKIFVRTECLDPQWVVSHPCPLNHGRGYFEWADNPFNSGTIHATYSDGTPYSPMMPGQEDIALSDTIRSYVSISHFYLKDEQHFHERALRGQRVYEETGDKGFLLDWQDKIDSGAYLKEMEESNEFEDDILKKWSIAQYGQDYDQILK